VQNVAQGPNGQPRPPRIRRSRPKVSLQCNAAIWSLSGDKRTLSSHRKLVAIDPQRLIATIDCRTAKGLFDHFVGPTEHRYRDGDAEGLGGLQVDVQLDFSCLLDRQVGGLLAFENAASIVAG